MNPSPFGFWLRLPIFLPIYLLEMLKSNARVALDVLRPRPDFRPGLLQLDLPAYGPTARWAAGCLISMTPGTLAIDVDDSTGIMTVHSLYLHDPEAARADLYRLLHRSLGPTGPSRP